MWESALKMIMDRPIQGYGLESYYFDSLRYIEPEQFELQQSNPDYDGKNVLANNPHNQTLYMGVSLGVVGMLLYLLLTGVLLWQLYRGFRRARDQDGAWFYGAVFCAVLAYFISVQFLWDLPPYTFYFWVLAGLAMGRPEAEAETEAAPEQEMPAPAARACTTAQEDPRRPGLGRRRPGHRRRHNRVDLRGPLPASGPLRLQRFHADAPGRRPEQRKPRR